MQRLYVTSCMLGLVVMLISAPVSAVPSEHLDWGYQVHASETSCPSGSPVLNVSYKIINSVDSGLGDNDSGAPWWAVIDYILQVRVIEIDEDTFCATVTTRGSFESVGGEGPGGTGDLDAGVRGTFEGGYTERFMGTFAPGDMSTHGNLGTFNHNCDPTMNDPDCDGAGVTRWLGIYFTGTSGFDFDEWWGWVYHGGNNGSWVNQINGNAGDITGD